MNGRKDVKQCRLCCINYPKPILPLVELARDANHISLSTTTVLFNVAMDPNIQLFVSSFHLFFNFWCWDKNPLFYKLTNANDSYPKNKLLKLNSNTNYIKSSPQTETERRVSDSFDGGQPSHSPLTPLLPSGTHPAVARAKRAKRKPPQVALRTGSQQLPNRRCVKPCTVSKYPHYCKCSNPLHRTRSRHLSILTWGGNTPNPKRRNSHFDWPQRGRWPLSEPLCSQVLTIPGHAFSHSSTPVWQSTVTYLQSGDFPLCVSGPRFTYTLNTFSQWC